MQLQSDVGIFCRVSGGTFQIDLDETDLRSPFSADLFRIVGVEAPGLSNKPHVGLGVPARGARGAGEATGPPARRSTNLENVRATDARKTRKQDETGAERRHAKVAVREAFEVARRRLQDYARRQRGDVKTHEVRRTA